MWGNDSGFNETPVKKRSPLPSRTSNLPSLPLTTVLHVNETKDEETMTEATTTDSATAGSKAVRRLPHVRQLIRSQKFLQLLISPLAHDGSSRIVPQAGHLHVLLDELEHFAVTVERIGARDVSMRLLDAVQLYLEDSQRAAPPLVSTLCSIVTIATTHERVPPRRDI